ncbi:MAG: hypothetical protein JTJ29_06885, partial [Bifidobacterium sp.]|nr:hypothetical protein [Bifidobacterium sp.]
MTSDFPCVPHPFTRIDRTIERNGERRCQRCPLAWEAGWKPTAPMHRESARTALRPYSHPAAKTQAASETPPGARARKTQRPASGKPLHIDCVSGTPENWRVRRGSANARLGHAYPWYA